MSKNKRRLVPICYAENSAERIRQELYEGSSLLHDVIDDIDDTGRDTVAYGHREITKTDVTAETGNEIALLGRPYFISHQVGKAEISFPII